MPVSEIVAWSEGLTLGVDSIDQQHIESIELINRVADAVGVDNTFNNILRMKIV